MLSLFRSSKQDHTRAGVCPSASSFCGHVKTICFSLIAVLGLKARRNEVCPHSRGRTKYKKAAAEQEKWLVFFLLLHFAAPCGGEEWKRTRAGVSACAAWECDIIRSISMFRNVICIIPFLAAAALGRKGRENICLARAL